MGRVSQFAFSEGLSAGIGYHEIAGLDNLAMNAIELLGDIDDDHRLHADIPKEVPAGPVRLIVLLPGEDAAGGQWTRGIAADWSAELQDAREDIYTLDDGQPVNAPR